MKDETKPLKLKIKPKKLKNKPMKSWVLFIHLYGLSENF